ncbi:MAG: sulfotransferase [Balneolaceae bacterium]|nr:sulfotransferase [Balneolaceae bacterium]
MKKIVFGIGTGRCGTVSLCKLLNTQKNANITHEDKEELPWEFSKEIIDRKLNNIRGRNGKYVGDIAFYYLPYVEYIIEKIPSVKFICLERKKEEVVKSYMKKTWGRNHWVNHKGIRWRKDPKWDKCYPKYDVLFKKSALRKYWDDYHQKSLQLEQLYPKNFKLMNMRFALNTREGVLELLKFIQITDNDIIVEKRIKANAIS